MDDCIIQVIRDMRSQERSKIVESIPVLFKLAKSGSFIVDSEICFGRNEADPVTLKNAFSNMKTVFDVDEFLTIIKQHSLFGEAYATASIRANGRYPRARDVFVVFKDLLKTADTAGFWIDPEIRKYM